MSDFFVPHQYVAKRPTMLPMQAPTGGGQQPPQVVIDSIVVPLSRVIDLSEIAGPGTIGSAGVVYERDYFLYHQLDYAAQALVISTDEDTTQTDFSIEVVTGATSLSAERVYEVLPKTPDRFDVTLIADGDAPVFLRVRSTYQSTLVYVTIELLTSKVT